MSEVLALNDNWLDSVNTVRMTQTVTQGATGDWPPYYGQYYYYPSYSYPVYITSPSRPIKLTLSEVERLRKAAKTDEKLKEILAKFTDQIEVTVDFN